MVEPPTKSKSKASAIVNTRWVACFTNKIEKNSNEKMMEICDLMI